MPAASAPQYRESVPVYIFKKITRAKGIFQPESPFGEITLDHYCIIVICYASPHTDYIKRG